MTWLVNLRKLSVQWNQHRPQSQANCGINAIIPPRHKGSSLRHTQPPTHTVNSLRLFSIVCPTRKVDCLLPSYFFYLIQWQTLVFLCLAFTNSHVFSQLYGWCGLQLCISLLFSQSGLSAEVYRGLQQQPAHWGRGSQSSGCRKEGKRRKVADTRGMLQLETERCSLARSVGGLLLLSLWSSFNLHLIQWGL